jgi:hypothetical protein
MNFGGNFLEFNGGLKSFVVGVLKIVDLSE